MMEKYDFSGEFSAQNKFKDKTDINFYSIAASMSVLGYILLSKIYATGVELLGLRRLVTGTQLANQSFTLVATMATILVPFLLAGSVEKKRTDIDICPLDKPNNPLLTALAVPAGVALCIIGSLVTNYITFFVSMFGVELTQPSLAAPPTGYALFLYILRLTLVAAVMEEVCFRGVVMQPLRKYGNFFAILMSAMVFALTHCNLIQAPAAFIAGIGIGYFTIATGSVWTGILIHLFNNLLVAVSQYYLAVGENDKAMFVGTTVGYIVLAVGLVCLVLFFVKRKTAKLNGGMQIYLSAGERVKAYILNPAMILTLFVIAFMTAQFISI